MTQQGTHREKLTRKDFEWRYDYVIYTPEGEKQGIRWSIDIIREDANELNIFIQKLSNGLWALCTSFLESSAKSGTDIVLQFHAYFEDEDTDDYYNVFILAFHEGRAALIINNLAPDKDYTFKEGEHKKTFSTQWITTYGTDKGKVCLNEIMMKLQERNFLDEKHFRFALDQFLEKGTHGIPEKPDTFREGEEDCFVNWIETTQQWCNHQGDY